MTNTKQRKLNIYCKATFKALKSNLEDWDANDPDVVRIITRQYYEGVFSCNYGDTGLISEDALNNSSERTDDHCFSPQFVGRFIMDNADVYLTDYDKFKEVFIASCTKIKVTKSENRKLQQLTENKRGKQYKVFVPTDKKYDHLGIRLYKRPENKTRWSDAQLTNEKITFLPDLLEYEKKFIVCQLNNLNTPA